MKRAVARAAIVAGAALILAGCSGDMTQQLLKSPEMQTKVMAVIAANAPMAGQMVDNLLGSDSTRAIVVGKLMADGTSMQAIMGKIAKDRTMIDGVLNLAVQDTAMRSHIMGVLVGMKMMEQR